MLWSNETQPNSPHFPLKQSSFAQVVQLQIKCENSKIKQLIKHVLDQLKSKSQRCSTSDHNNGLTRIYQQAVYSNASPLNNYLQVIWLRAVKLIQKQLKHTLLSASSMSVKGSSKKCSTALQNVVERNIGQRKWHITFSNNFQHTTKIFLKLL